MAAAVLQGGWRWAVRPFFWPLRQRVCVVGTPAPGRHCCRWL